MNSPSDNNKTMIIWHHDKEMWYLKAMSEMTTLSYMWK